MIESLGTKTKIFFILTEQCRNQKSRTPCDQMDLGTMSIARTHSNSFLAPGSLQTGSAPGYRVGKRIYAQEFFEADLAAYTEAQDAQRTRYLRGYDELPEQSSPYVVDVYVYCPPCACQIATALDIRIYHQKSPFVDFHIRVDHGRPASCCPSMSNIDGLISLVEYLKKAEIVANLWSGLVERLKAFDREWLDEAIYNADEKKIVQTPSRNDQLTQIVRHHFTDENTAAIVILGEADYCIGLMGTGPFPPIESGSVLRENQIFMMCQRYVPPLRGRRWEREYVGEYSPKAPIVSSRSPTSPWKDVEKDKSPVEGRKQSRSSN